MSRTGMARQGPQGGETDAPDVGGRSATHTHGSFAALLLGVTSYALLQSFVTPMLPTLRVELEASQGTTTWVLTAYLVSAAVFTPLVGRVGDLMGRRAVLVATLGVLAAGACLAAMATDIDVVIGARVVQGVGGGVLPLAFGLVREILPAEKVPGAIAALASTIGVGSGVGIVAAGPIVELLGYHWLFWIPMLLSLLAAGGVLAFVPRTSSVAGGRLSGLSVLLTTSWLVTVLLGISRGGSWGWGSSRTILTLTAGVVLLAVWSVRESRSNQPLIPVTHFRLAAIRAGSLVAFLLGATLYASYAFMPQLAQASWPTGGGLSMAATDAGRVMAPASVCTFLFSIASRRLGGWRGNGTAVALGCATVAAAMALVAFTHQNAWHLYLASGVLGAGIGLTYACLTALVVSAVPADQTGIATAVNANVMTIGGAIGATVFSSILTHTARGSAPPSEAGYVSAFVVLAITMLLATVVAGSHTTRTSRTGRRPRVTMGGVQTGEPATHPGSTKGGSY